MGKIVFFRGKMGSYVAYKCGIFLVVEAQYGRLIFETDYKLRMFDKPWQSAIEKLKHHDISQCDRLNLEIKRIYHTRVSNRGYYNIYSFNIEHRSVYFVEHYHKKFNIYDFEAFDTFEDAMAYIYS